MSSAGTKGRTRIGILDATGRELGGGQLVAATLAAQLAEVADVDIISAVPEYALDSLGDAFALDLARVRLRLLPTLPGNFHIPGPLPLGRQLREGNPRDLTAGYDLFIYSGIYAPPFNFARRGMIYCHFPFDLQPVEENLRTLPRWKERHPLDRWLRRHIYSRYWRKRMRGYQRILANSRYTAGWIERRWGRAAEVVYPPVEVELPAAMKRNLIVSVGRFTGTKRSKNQREQVEVFRKFLTRAGEPWQLALAGSCTPSEGGEQYLDAVRHAAEGLPVAFHVNANRATICRLLAEARMFWHTTGLGVDESRFPHEAEHFGIATVEAMRACCVPVVIASGGQREIIEDGASGFLTSDLDEFLERTAALAHDRLQLEIVAGRARERSLAFARSVFDRKTQDIVAVLLRQ